MNLRIPMRILSGIFVALSFSLVVPQTTEAAYRLTVGVAPFSHDVSTLKEEESETTSVPPEDDEAIVIPGLDGMEIEIEEAEKTEEEVAEEAAALSAAIIQPEFERASLEIRNAEALALQNYLRIMLDKKGGELFDKVINAPAGVNSSSSLAASVDLWVEVTVEAANAEKFAIRVNASTSAGESILKNKKFSQAIAKDVFVNSKNQLKEGYHETLSKVSEAIVSGLKAKNLKGDYDRYEDFTNLKFAVYMAPEVFNRDNYLNRRGSKIKSLPSEDDSYYREALEARLATVEIYQNFDSNVVETGRSKSYSSYAVWRYRSFLAANEYLEARKEIKALQGKIAKAVALKLLGPIVINEFLKNNNVAQELGLGEDFDKIQDAAVIILTLKSLSDIFMIQGGRIQFNEEKLRQSDSNFGKKFTERREKIGELSVDSNVHAEKLIELQKSFTHDLAPIDIEYRGRSFTLTGQIEDKVAALQRILREDYKQSVSQA
ncbi:hypothetical protein MLD52_15530 [Puniceicoccaceae bacterium K14]|nr:hypothetical protein [Puniceicoccaceae bacterium K14]